MANIFYENTTRDFLPGTTADGGAVDDELDAIESGFEIAQARVYEAIRLTAGDHASPAVLPGDSIARANKVVGFDSGGGLTLYDKADESTAAAAQAAAEEAQAAAELAEAGAIAAQVAAELAESGAQTAEAGAVTARTAAESALSSATGYQRKTSAYTLVAGDRILGDVSGGAFTLNLPASPSEGDAIWVSSASADASTLLTVSRNGNTINGASEDFEFDVDVEVIFSYLNGGWRAF